MLTTIDGPIPSFLLGGTCGHKEIHVDIFKLRGPSIHLETFLVEQAALILPKETSFRQLLDLWVKHALGQIPEEFWDPRFNKNIKVPRTHLELPVSALDHNGRISLFPGISVNYRCIESGLRVTKPDENQLSQVYFN